MDKFALVYEFNKDSPLLTYVASKEIDAGNYSEALKLLTKAVEKFPYNPTANLLYSLALAYNNEFSRADEVLKNSIDLINNSNTLNYYKNLIDKIKLESKGVAISLDDTVSEVLDDSFVEPEEYNSETEFELLNDTNENELLDEKENSVNDDSIVTETLAEIYASQENFKEALDVYNKLKILRPELKEKYDLRISEINIAIENKKLKKFGN